MSLYTAEGLIAEKLPDNMKMTSPGVITNPGFPAKLIRGRSFRGCNAIIIIIYQASTSR